MDTKQLITSYNWGPPPKKKNYGYDMAIWLVVDGCGSCCPLKKCPPCQPCQVLRRNRQWNLLEIHRNFKSLKWTAFLPKKDGFSCKCSLQFREILASGASRSIATIRGKCLIQNKFHQIPTSAPVMLSA